MLTPIHFSVTILGKPLTGLKMLMQHRHTLQGPQYACSHTTRTCSGRRLSFNSVRSDYRNARNAVTPAAVETPASSGLSQQAGWEEFASNFSGMTKFSVAAMFVVQAELCKAAPTPLLFMFNLLLPNCFLRTAASQPLILLPETVCRRVGGRDSKLQRCWRATAAARALCAPGFQGLGCGAVGLAEPMQLPGNNGRRQQQQQRQEDQVSVE